MYEDFTAKLLEVLGLTTQILRTRGHRLSTKLDAAMKELLAVNRIDQSVPAPDTDISQHKPSGNSQT